MAAETKCNAAFAHTSGASDTDAAPPSSFHQVVETARSSSVGAPTTLNNNTSITTRSGTSNTIRRNSAAATTNIPFMHSVRDYLDDVPLENPSQRNSGGGGSGVGGGGGGRFHRRHVEVTDEVGEAMVRLFNASPDFNLGGSTADILEGGHHHSHHHHAARGNSDESSASTLQPILSMRNFMALLSLLQILKTKMLQSKPSRDLPALGKRLWKFLFWNIKPPIWNSVLAYCILSFAFLSVLATGVAFAGAWAFKFLSMVGFLSLSLLVDWREISTMLPPGCHKCLAQLSAAGVWVDQIVLQARRYQGREWNKDDFEYAVLAANRARSSQQGQQLWQLPPPSVSQVGLANCTKLDHLHRPEWGEDTTQHIAAVGYCYLALREEFVQKQYSRLRRSVVKRLESDDSLGESCVSNTTTLASGVGVATVDVATGAVPRDVVDISSRTVSFTPKSRTLPGRDSLSIGSLEDFRRSLDVDSRTTFNMGPEDEYMDANLGLRDMDISLLLKDILEDESDESDNDSARKSHSRSGSLDSGSDTGKDMNWMDVGAEIGIKLLGSAAVQKAMASQDTAEKIITIKEKVESHMSSVSHNPHPQHHQNRVDYDIVRQAGEVAGEGDHPYAPSKEKIKKLSLPVNPMWTSASAAISPAQSYATDPGDEKAEQLMASYASSLDDSIPSSAKSKSRINEIKQRNMTSDKFHHRRSSDSTIGTNENGPEATTIDVAKANALTRNTAVLKSKSFVSPSAAFRPASSSVEVVCDDSDSRKVVIKSASSMTSPSRDHPKRPLLLPGVKIVVPIFPVQPGGCKPLSQNLKSRFQMATVVSSKRLCVYAKNKMPPSGKRGTNCLSITVKLDKCFLRNGEFATMTLRVMDEWSSRYMPKHSKLPLGSCVATSFGLGILVGWRVEDDMHVVRSLWQRRGPGSACAYLRRDSIHSTVEAAVGFDVGTLMGQGKVVAYVNGGPDFRCGRYFVKIFKEGRHHGQILELNRADVLSCQSARFIPIVEHIREAAQYQLQIDVYEEILKERETGHTHESEENKLWGEFSKHFNILWKSFLRAIEEDDEFDEGMNAFIQQCVNFLDRLDASDGSTLDAKGCDTETSFVITTTDSSQSSNKSTLNTATSSEKTDSGFWLMNNMFDIFRNQENATDKLASDELNFPDECIEVECATTTTFTFDKTYERAFAVLRTLMRTVTIARAASADQPDFKMALSVVYEFLLFVKTVIKVQQKNMNPASIKVWRRAWEEIVSVFGPVKDRLTRIGTGIAERMEKQGRRAKVRLLRFVDIVVQDDALLLSIEQGDWGRCVDHIEVAMVRAKIIDELSREHYHKTGKFLFNHFVNSAANSKSAAARNNEKFAQFLMVLQLFAAPRKSFLKLFLQDWVLDAIERILVRVFSKDAVACRMLTIHSSNFQTLRQFRMLKDFTIAGKLWIPLLDAADEEFSWLVSSLPDNAKEFLSPFASLFSLCVVQFHKINEGDLTKDWLDFLLEDDAASIIHDIDMKVILALEAFSRDVKETMVVLPYYPSIDDDILKLVDEVNVDELVKEASEALEDDEMFRYFIKDKVSMAIERFLDYLPKLSIPVEKRDLGNGWTLTCRGADGGDLTLTDMTIKRENLRCQVLGGNTIFFPMTGDGGELDSPSTSSKVGSPRQLYPSDGAIEESSILDHIRELILNAQRYGCWQVGVGGVNLPHSDKYVASALQGIPISSVLNCAIDLWRNLEIDDDELLEIAIRDISYQIQLQQQREELGEDTKETKEDSPSSASATVSPWKEPKFQSFDSFEQFRHRFNPRVDPTVFHLEIKNLTFNLENFLFRIEKHESKRTIFDPVFEGSGSVLVQNVCVKLRVECVKQCVCNTSNETVVPVLQLRELDVSLEKVDLRVKDTGADWLLNKVVEGFGGRFTEIMSSNLCDQVRNHIEDALNNLNSYFEANPEVLLGLLDITLDDLDEKIVWV